MFRFAFIALLILTFSANQLEAQKTDEAPAATLTALDWMAGHWSGELGGRSTEEVWMAPKGQMMLGMNRAVAGNGATMFEFLRIVVDGKSLTYHASPGGMKPTAFQLKELTDSRVVFENLKNDFPQRIIYHRTGNEMTGRIEGRMGDQDQAMEWKWRLETPARN